MEKKDYKHPSVQVIQIDAKCMIGNESGSGTGDSLTVEFEEETRVEE